MPEPPIVARIIARRQKFIQRLDQAHPQAQTLESKKRQLDAHMRPGDYQKRFGAQQLAEDRQEILSSLHGLEKEVAQLEKGIPQFSGKFGSLKLEGKTPNEWYTVFAMRANHLSGAFEKRKIEKNVIRHWEERTRESIEKMQAEEQKTFPSWKKEALRYYLLLEEYARHTYKG
ncbi:MAG: hypothetical protein V1847_01515 [Candidatus Diapherotrites archaeon]